MFQKKKLAYGVQWEIARLVTSETRVKDGTNPFSFDDIVISMLDDLRGTSADNAPKTTSHLLRHCSRLSDDAWIEKAFSSEMAAKVCIQAVKCAPSFNFYSRHGKNLILKRLISRTTPTLVWEMERETSQTGMPER
jgi:hypothetical protein